MSCRQAAALVGSRFSRNWFAEFIGQWRNHSSPSTIGTARAGEKGIVIRTSDDRRAARVCSGSCCSCCRSWRHWPGGSSTATPPPSFASRRPNIPRTVHSMTVRTGRVATCLDQMLSLLPCRSASSLPRTSSCRQMPSIARPAPHVCAAGCSSSTPSASWRTGARSSSSWSSRRPVSSSSACFAWWRRSCFPSS